MRFDWSKLGRTPPSALSVARTLAHHAVQWPAKAARANLRTAPDDSHSAFTWEASHAALLTQGLPAKGGDVRVGVRIPRLELIITRGDNVLDAFQMGGKTDAQAGVWLDAKLRVLSLKQAGDVRLPYELPEHPLGSGSHQLAMLGRELGELARWFGGASPGDEYYNQPYFYVSPYPRFDGEKLPDPPSPGHWHTEGFFGAVLTGDDVLALKDRGRGLTGFINRAFDIARTRLGARP